ncbi:MAG: CbrC family protein [archaeon]|nr:CbrC family protein [archaeon]
MARLKYFLEPEKFAYILDGEHECDICHQRRKCFDGKGYYIRSRILEDVFKELTRRFPDPKKMKRKERIEYRVRLAEAEARREREEPKAFKAFCFECVAEGRLLEVRASAVEGDFGALKRQMQSKNPNASANEIEKQAREITKQLEGSTPKFPTWQDWHWPAHCGDYCQFIRLAGQDDFNKLAEDGNGKELFRNSLYGDLKETENVDLIWSRLKPDSVSGIIDPNDNWSPMAYIFKCLKCGAIVTIYDFD